MAISTVNLIKNTGTTSVNVVDKTTSVSVDLVEKTTPVEVDVVISGGIVNYAQGADGQDGATGPQGPAGPQGPQGDVGPQGDTGATGDTGPQGPPGDDGDGITNITQNQDNTLTITYGSGSTLTTDSVIGPQGDKGDTGDTGPQGPQGDGFTGGSYDSNTGIVTFTSNDNLGFSTGNLRGADGQDGADGDDGVGIASTQHNQDGTLTLNYTDNTSFTTGDLTGPQGPQGIQGDEGDQGIQGIQGPQGPQGAGFTNQSGYDNATGIVTFTSNDGLGFSTGDLRGADGADAEGVPSGGNTGQFLRKQSSTDYDFAWEDFTLSTNLSDINDVTITNPTNEQIIAYNSTTGNWENTELVGGLWTEGTGGDIYYTSGDVGIGTTNPTSKLHVVGKVSLSDGDNNVAIGINALASNVAGGGSAGGTKNVAIGNSALSTNTSGDDNVAVGASALQNATTANYNFALGSNALRFLTTGSANTGIGLGTLEDVSTGSNNVGIGMQSAQQINTGSFNVAVGSQSLSENTSGTNNVAIGRRAGTYISGGLTANATPSQSIYIGNQTEASADGNTNEIVVGYDATGNGSNTITLGNSSITNTYLKGLVSDGLSYPTTDGTSGQAIVTDGSGNLSFSTISGGGSSLWTEGTGGDIYYTGGDVGIGTTSPSFKLHVAGQAMYSANGYKLGNGYTVSVHGYNSAIRFNNANILINDSNASEFVRFHGGNARVGIGTTSPSAKLHVEGKMILKEGTDNIAISTTTSTMSALTTDGQRNIAIGTQVLEDVEDGDNNIAIGFQSGANITSGRNNVAIGYRTLRVNTEGDKNFAIGNDSLYQLTTASNNTAVGDRALQNVTTGQYNLGMGAGAGVGITTGSNNFALGGSAMRLVQTGNDNVAIGTDVMKDTGTNVSFNIAIGDFALRKTQTSNNVAIGKQALTESQTGTLNVAIGTNALQNNTTGSNNIAVGYQAGLRVGGGSINNQTSSNSVYIGNLTDAGADGNTNEVVIGYNAIGNGSNTVTLGNDSIVNTYLKGDVGIGTTSPNASAKLQIDSTTQGVLLPRLTTTQVNAISSPATGLTVYNTTLNQLCFYNGTEWRKVSDSTM